MQGGSAAAAAAAAAAASAAAAAAAAAFQGIRPPQFPEPEHQQLKCPRCDSTNTKFCYYNNYNLSQPRHFCKSCRRYWTKGGALRNIPVGGGTRKNSKRSNGSTKNGATNDDSNSNSGNASADASARTSGSNPSKRANNNNSNPLAEPTTPTPTPTAPAPTALSSSSDPPAGLPKPELLPPLYPSGEQDRPMFEVGGTFSSLLSSTHHFGGLMGIPSLNSSHLDLGGPIGSTTLADLLPAGNGCDDAAATAPATAIEEDFLSLQGDPGCWATGADRGGGDGGAGVRGGGWPGLSIYRRDADFH